MPLAKTQERQRARSLRAKGHSVKDIAKKLCVSRGSVSVWVRDVLLTAAQRKKLEERSRGGLSKASKASAKTLKRQAQERREQARQEADKAWPALRTDPDFMFGLALYVGEGSKDPHIIDITNADPRVLRAGVGFFELLGLSRDQIRVTVILHLDGRPRAALNYWVQNLSLPRAQFYPITASKKSGGKQKGRLPHGTAKIRINDTYMKTKLTRYMDLAL